MKKPAVPFYSYSLFRSWLHRVFAAMVLLLAGGPAFGQNPFPPPNQLQVYSIQGLDFGTFYTGVSGGAVVIAPDGSRTTTGSVLGLAGEPGMQAIFNIRLIPGRVVHVSFGASAMLTHHITGQTMTINQFTSDKPMNSFVTTAGHPFLNPVRVGATLQVGSISANPSGSYSGFFSVTFIQE